jgi:1,4-alpha-glucan branching enzyme
VLKKMFDQENQKCLVTFELPAEAGVDAACICGDFNDWDETCHPLEHHKDGRLTISLQLDLGRSYRFRYLLGDGRWENDWAADRYESNLFGSEDSVVDLTSSPPNQGVDA